MSESHDPNWEDPIVEEVRRVRQEHAARFNFDLNAIVADIRSKQEKSGEKTVALPPRPSSQPPKEGAA